MDELKKKFINGLVEENAFFVRKEPFNLHSGGHSHIFVNPMNYIIKPKNLEFLTEILANMAKNLDLTDYKLAAGPSVGGYTLTTALAYLSLIGCSLSKISFCCLFVKVHFSCSI